MGVYAYLILLNGPLAGANYPLKSSGENRIGRGTECDVSLADPLSSRVHAVLVQQDGEWWVRDQSSRNGTFVNDQKADEAQLSDGHTVRIGSTELSFHLSEKPPAEDARHDINVTQTLVKEAPVSPQETGNFALAALRDAAHAQDFLTLYQLTIRLLSSDDPDEVIAVSLDLLRARAKAAIVGFLWISDDGKLKPKLVIPESAADRVTLSRSLTEIVIERGRAIWVAETTAADETESLAHYADAICVPLRHEGAAVGAIHLYLERGRFKAGDLEFAISLANIMAAALVRTRKQASLAAEHRRLADKSGSFDELIGDSPGMTTLKEKIARVARTTGCVLIRGESGSGKELVARAVHRLSPRGDRPLLSVNCAAIPSELMESQLFGHVKGAFTSADSDHKGWFQQADSGTLFLDEVGEMTLEGQAKLLRILEGHPFLQVGGAKEIRVDVRVIAATNRDLAEFVRERRFREDLYYRLSVFELHIPPLRERGADIERLVDFFLEHFKRQHGRPNLSLSKDARKKLLGYHWPGNVRQLRNVIDSAVVLADGDAVQADDLGLRDAGGGELESLRIDVWEKKLIAEALKRTANKAPQAAELLGVSRATLYRKIDEYKIERP
ncbi:MAG: sigma 54-interacting transcriptional regulator [Planctomycetes bacterium]|nr:sigma 54-interacting transcriptional regulator [Planctomycetota bacterium]